MEITIQNLTKIYDQYLILDKVNLSLPHGSITALTGPNGSGKSTLLQIISGYLSPSEGVITLTHNDQILDRDVWYKYLAITAPYIDLEEDMTLIQYLKHYIKFKNLSSSHINVLGESQLTIHGDKSINELSSGMIQRLKLSIALLTDVPLILLDEPTSFLDSNYKNWFYKLIKEHHRGRTIVIATNDPDDLLHVDSAFSINA